MNTFLRTLGRLGLGKGHYEWIDIDGEPDTDGSIRLLILGPEDTPFADGIFTITMKISNEYPYAAPHIHFNTRIWHPLVEWSSGRVCQDYFHEDWQAADGLVTLLTRIRAFFSIKKTSSSVNFEAAQQIARDDGSYEVKAHEEMLRHATG